MKETGTELGPYQTRLNGLSISRALGDQFVKQQKLGVVCEPYISDPIQLEPTDSVIVLASDGVGMDFQ